MSCTYLAHHELEPLTITVISIYVTALRKQMICNIDGRVECCLYTNPLLAMFVLHVSAKVNDKLQMSQHQLQPKRCLVCEEV